MSGLVILHSAGLDSTLALHDALVANDRPVLALHVLMRGLPGDRGEVELHWVEQQWVWLRNKGFTFESRIVEVPAEEVRSAPHFAMVLLRCAAEIIRDNPGYTRVQSGRCAEDDDSPTADWAPHSGIFKDICGIEYETARLFSPHRTRTKEDLFGRLPGQLRRTLWACANPRPDPSKGNRPEESIQCHQCKPCLSYKKAGRLEEVYWIEPPEDPGGRPAEPLVNPNTKPKPK